MLIRRVVGSTLILLSIWLTLVDTLSLTNIAIGLLLAALVNIFFSEAVHRYISPRILNHIFTGLLYLPLFIVEIFSASFRLALQVFQPRPKLKPAIVALPLEVSTPTAMTMLAIMVTLTPGTLALDLDPKQRLLYIHWVDVTTTNKELYKDKEASIGDMELWAKRIFQR